MSQSGLRKRVAAIVAVLATSVALSCGEREPGATDASAPHSGEVLAKVGRATITQGDLEAALEALPSHQRAQYQGVSGRQRLLDELVKRKLIMLAAEDLHLDERPEVRERLADFRERLLTSAYHEYLVEALPEPTEEDLKAYYDAHQDEFIIPARVNASWVKCATREEAERARQRVLDGEKITAVAREVTIDECSKKDGGFLGYFNPTGYIRCIGNNPEFAAKAFELEADDVGPVFEWDGGWAFIRVHEKSTERIEPFRKARERIVMRLRPKLTQEDLNREIARLESKYGVETFMDASAELAGKSAEDLMRLATEAGNPNDRIFYYRALLRKYPHYERADEAQFMIGFVYSEELKDCDQARVEYQKVLDGYPDSQIRESAHYMLQNLCSDETPAFEEPAASTPGTE